MKQEDTVKYALLAVGGYLVYANWDRIWGGLNGEVPAVVDQSNGEVPAVVDLLPLTKLSPEQQAQIQAALDLGHEVVGIHPEGGYVMVADRSSSGAHRISRIGEPTGVTTRAGSGTTGRGSSGGGSMRALDYNKIVGGSWS